MLDQIFGVAFMLLALALVINYLKKREKRKKQVQKRKHERKRGMNEDITFVVRLRAGGKSGSSLQLTVPKDVATFLELKKGDYVKVAVEKLEREKQ